MTDSGNIHRSGPSKFSQGPPPPSNSVTHRQPARPENAGTRPSHLNAYMTTTGHESPLPTAPPSVMNMGAMRSALPDYQSHPIPFDQYHNAHAQFMVQPPGVFYQMYIPSFQGGQSADWRVPAYSMAYPTVYPQYYPQPHPQPSYQGVPAFINSTPSHSGVQVPMYGQSVGYNSEYYPSPYPVILGHSPGPPQRPPDLLQSGLQHFRSYVPTNLGPNANLRTGRLQRQSFQPAAANNDASKTIVDGSSKKSESRSSGQSISPSSVPTPTQIATQGGPRRTPKQSGHALWVGNLPPGTSIVDLKDHFSQDVADDIESVFLISKSNCAFINYRTEPICSAAQTKFHDSRFQGVRLVCRLRRGIASAGSNSNAEGNSSTSPSTKDAENPSETDSTGNRVLAVEKVPNRYFIVKSLTVEDLDSSRQSGIWATQSHNEVNLNRAYETAGNVYLIFSANKSGEYFGYARMVSPIQEDEKLALEMPPRSNQKAPEAEELNVTLTEATPTARSGRIIDDPVRRTIFWEADSVSEDDADDQGDDASHDKNSSPVVADGLTTPDANSQTIGRPFRLQWLSNERVPFHRTRGLRNPWNANRAVKIARDGTEVEPNVGAQLVELFHISPSG